MLHQLIWNFGSNFTNMSNSDNNNSVAYNFLSNVKSHLMISQTLQTYMVTKILTTYYHLL